MFFFFLHVSPWFVAGFAALMSSWQWRSPDLYPWPLVMSLALYVLMSLAFLWRSTLWRSGAAALLPPFFAILVVGFGHLMIEQTGLRMLTTALFTLLPWLALQLGWFMLYQSHHYPAKAFTRFNLALIPVSMWYLFATLQGIQVFLQFLPWVLMAVCVGVTFSWFAITLRSWKERCDKRWLWASVLIGAHFALLLVLLPISISVQGALVALLVALPLRLRHLAHERRPFFRALWIEGGVLSVLWMGVLLTARWS